MLTDDHDRECPACDSAALGEWDAVLRVYVCPTCSTTWRLRVDRELEATRATRDRIARLYRGKTA
jgi:hypothetical protein